MENKDVRSSENKAIRELAKKVARERIAPKASERDLNRTFPWDCIRLLGETGFLGLIISEDHGGFGVGRNFFAAIVEDISKAAREFSGHLIIRTDLSQKPELVIIVNG